MGLFPLPPCLLVSGKLQRRGVWTRFKLRVRLYRARLFISDNGGEKNERQTDTRVVLGVIEYKYIITM